MMISKMIALGCASLLVSVAVSASSDDDNLRQNLIEQQVWFHGKISGGRVVTRNLNDRHAGVIKGFEFVDDSRTWDYQDVVVRLLKHIEQTLRNKAVPPRQSFEPKRTVHTKRSRITVGMNKDSVFLKITLVEDDHSEWRSLSEYITIFHDLKKTSTADISHQEVMEEWRKRICLTKFGNYTKAEEMPKPNALQVAARKQPHEKLLKRIAQECFFAEVTRLEEEAAAKLNQKKLTGITSIANRLIKRGDSIESICTIFQEKGLTKLEIMVIIYRIIPVSEQYGNPVPAFILDMP